MVGVGGGGAWLFERVFRGSGSNGGTATVRFSGRMGVTSVYEDLIVMVVVEERETIPYMGSNRSLFIPVTRERATLLHVRVRV